MKDVRRNINAIIRDATSFNITIEVAENRIAELIEFEIDEVKEKVANAVRDLPSECVYGYDEIKFCPNRLSGNNSCKECFSLDNI